MQSVTYHLDASELDDRLIDSIKSLFKSGRVMVTVEPEEKEITNAELLSAIQSDQESIVQYIVPSDDFVRLSDQFFNDESFDIVGEIRKHEQPK